MLLYIPKMVSDKKIKSSLLNTEKHNLMISYFMKPDLFFVSLIMLIKTYFASVLKLVNRQDLKSCGW